jgi:hypothetical protein
VLTAIGGVEMIEAQQLGQPEGVDLVTLLAFPQGGILSQIAHHQFRHLRFQFHFSEQVVFWQLLVAV